MPVSLIFTSVAPGTKSSRTTNKPDRDCYMKYKCLAAAVYLGITLASATLPANAGQVTSNHPHQTTRITDTGNTTPGTGKTDNSQTGLDLLDAVWVFGFTIAGLLLLRKVQGE